MKTYLISIMLNKILLQYLVEVITFPPLAIRSAKNLRLLVWKENKFNKKIKPSDLSWAIFKDIDEQNPIATSPNWNQTDFEEATWE